MMKNEGWVMAVCKNGTGIEGLIEDKLYCIRKSSDADFVQISNFNGTGRDPSVYASRFSYGIPQLYIPIRNKEEFDAVRGTLMGRGFVWMDCVTVYSPGARGIYTDSEGHCGMTTFTYNPKSLQELHELQIEYKIVKKEVFKIPSVESAMTKEQALQHIEKIKTIIGE